MIRKRVKRIKILLAISFALCFCACADREPTVSDAATPPNSERRFPHNENSEILGSLEAHERLGDLPQRILHLIAARDFSALASFVHPVKGLRCSPYAFVDAESDVVLQADELLAESVRDTPRLWGRFDGTGEPIELDIEEYFTRFVYDADFYNAAQIGYDMDLGSGNTINNAREFYPQARIVEYHFPGFDKNLGGLDWRSLRLVFEQHESRWFLVGLIHDLWTT